MNVQSWLRQAKLDLANTSPTASLDAEILLINTLGVNRAWLYAHDDYVLKDKLLKDLGGMLKRRMNHEPVAYIVGKAYFYGREYIVSPDTLQPRPETETMIELLLSQDQHDAGSVIVDVGTGSGCIAITARLELASTDTSFFGTDISTSALTIAKQNAELQNVPVDFRLGNLIEPVATELAGRAHVILLTNLPYVPDSHTINEAARHEPDVAIFGGLDGLDVYRELFVQIDRYVENDCVLYTESLPPQHLALERLANQHGFKQKTSQDLIQVFEKK